MNTPLTPWQQIFAQTYDYVVRLWCALFHTHEEIEVSSIPLPQMQRQWLYDFHIAHPEAYAAALGLPPYSEEGAEHERIASDKRIARIEPLLPLLIEQGEWMAKVMVHAGLSANDIASDGITAALENYRHLFVHNCMSLAATLADMGVLHVER